MAATPFFITVQTTNNQYKTEKPCSQGRNLEWGGGQKSCRAMHCGSEKLIHLQKQPCGPSQNTTRENSPHTQIQHHPKAHPPYRLCLRQRGEVSFHRIFMKLWVYRRAY